MKKETFIALSLVLLMGVSCSSNSQNTNAQSKPDEKSLTIVEQDVTNGKKLYTDKGCLACHQLDKKLIGPSIKSISAAYAGNKNGLTAYLKGEGEPIVDPVQVEIMKPQILITKALPEKELEAIVDYILSVK